MVVGLLIILTAMNRFMAVNLSHFNWHHEGSSLSVVKLVVWHLFFWLFLLQFLQNFLTLPQ